ncbi:MAG: lipoate protein ligase C-terminal domain-containing protein [Candidatus Korarchaeota archaeon]|nr:lipoate protein ligase C-terminal domain-containing protein [Candidatus Korarchaeota archaeon]
MMRKVVRSRSGKTLEVILDVEEDRISQLVISGDFMAFPPQIIEELEKSLVGKKAEEVEGVVREVLKGTELIGVEIDEIIDTIRELASSR